MAQSGGISALARLYPAAVAAFSAQNSAIVGPSSDYPELDCLSGILGPSVLTVAARLARETGVGAERILIDSGAISEENYLVALAGSLGFGFETFDNVNREDCPASDAELIEAPRAGMLQIRDRGAQFVVVAPGNLGARNLVRRRRAGELPDYIFLTSPQRLRQFVERTASRAIARKASEALRDTRPALSAATSDTRAKIVWIAILISLAAGALSAPALMHAALGATLGVVFFAWIALRLFAIAKPPLAARNIPRIPARDLPQYSIVVALYREARVVKRLVKALDAIDYPKQKLQIQLAIEADDVETRAALEALKLGPQYEIVIVPRMGPRTKPKALNAALLYTRGSFVAVFDAEDRPEPDQLRRAFDEFRRSDQRLACVQAQLLIDNTEDSWLTQLFTAEYCGLFDVFLPGLAAHRLPLPLGGSSNHFRTAVLREVGGWDAYNVTEDADLGVRLARSGYTTGVIASTTDEEAPAQLLPWLRQRTRWFKGWMQTWLVHMRQPLAMLRELGLAGFLTFQLVVGGTVLAALVIPFVAAMWIWPLLATVQPTASASPLIAALSLFNSFTFLAGYLTSAALGYVGLRRRNLQAHAWYLILVPVLWILLSIAAWRACFQLVRNPYHWEKTEHGLAKHSRGNSN